MAYKTISKINRKKKRVLRNWAILIGSLIAIIGIVIIVIISGRATAVRADAEPEIIVYEDDVQEELSKEATILAEVDLSTELDLDDYIGEDHIYQASEYIEVLKYLAACPTVYYSGDDWSSWNGSAWQFDCLCLPKSILYWGWNGDKSAANGGAIYSRRKDYTEDRMIDKCSDISSDFSVLTPGELLYMEGHVGTYIGDGMVIECTDAFADGGVLITEIDSEGNRSYKGQSSLYNWEYHGFITAVDYDTYAERLN